MTDFLWFCYFTIKSSKSLRWTHVKLVCTSQKSQHLKHKMIKHNVKLYLQHSWLTFFPQYKMLIWLGIQDLEIFLVDKDTLQLLAESSESQTEEIKDKITGCSRLMLYNSLCFFSLGLPGILPVMATTLGRSKKKKNCLSGDQTMISK